MLTPRDIESKMFKVSIKGYNIGQVDDFLQEICDSYVELYMENKKNREDIERLSVAVGEYKSMEGTIRDAVTIADETTDRIERDAMVKAAEIIRAAERTAESIVAGAEQKIDEEAYRLEQIKKETELYKSKIIDLLNAQLRVMGGYPQYEIKEPRKETKKETAKWYESIEPAATKKFETDEYRTKAQVDYENTATMRVEKEEKEFYTERMSLVTERDTVMLPRIFGDENGGYTAED